MSMIQATVEPEKKGAAIGALGFVMQYVTAIMSLVIGSMVDKYDLNAKQRNFGTMCAILTAGPSLIASFCFFMAGPQYEKIKIQQKKEIEEAVTKADENEIELTQVEDLQKSIASMKFTLMKQKRDLI